MHVPKFSLIVPCYNTEKYLDECMVSLLQQTFADFEVLLVNDGSTDRTLASCRKWEALDGRIRVIDKKNGGLSDARNAGMAASQGQFLVFVDSDDSIEPRALEEINGTIEPDTEIVLTRLLDDYGTDVLLRDSGMEAFFSGDTSLDRVLSWVMQKSQNTWPAQGYVVSRKYVSDNGLSFLVGYVHEDVDWTTRLFSKARNVSLCFMPWYHHRRERPGSITHTITPKRISDVLEIAHALIDGQNAVLEDYPERFRQMVADRIMESVFPIVLRYGELASRREKDSVIGCLEKNRSIFRHQPRLKYRIFMLFVKPFGFKKVLDACSAPPICWLTSFF